MGESPDPATRSARRVAIALVLLSMAGGVLLRTSALGAQGLWHDEFHTFALVRGADLYLFEGSDLRATEPLQPASEYRALLSRDRFRETLGRNLTHEGHPPLYYFAVRAVTESLGATPTTLRLPSLVFGIALIPAIALLAWTVAGPRTGAASAVLTAASPFVTHFSFEARSYAMGLVLIALTAWVTARIAYRRELPAGSALMFVVLATASLYTHYYLVFSVGLLACIVLFAGVRSSLPRRLLVVALPGIFFVPWLPTLYAQVATHEGSHWTEGVVRLSEVPGCFFGTLKDLLLSRGALSSDGDALAAAGLFLVLIVGAVQPSDRSSQRGPVVMGMLVFLHFVAVLVFDRITEHRTFCVPRYSFAVFVPLIVLVAVLVVRARFIGLLFVALFSFYSVSIALATATGDVAPRQMLREAARYLSAEAGEDAAILVTPSGPTLVGLAYYADRPLTLGTAPFDEAAEKARKLQQDGRPSWLAVQRLGDHSRAPSEIAKGFAERKRFAGIDLYHFPAGNRTE